MMSNLILDACMPFSKKTCEYHAFVRTDSRFPHSTPDEVLLEELSKEGRVIATRDSGFMVHALSRGQEVCFLTRSGHLYKITGKAEIVEPYFKQRFGDKISHTILESDSVILP